jgi:hypothetical protein
MGYEIAGSLLDEPLEPIISHAKDLKKVWKGNFHQ